MFKLTLETTDYEDTGFVQYLAEHEITFKPTGVTYHNMPGGGEDVVYTSANKEALLTMIDDFWGGRDEFDFTIEEI